MHNAIISELYKIRKNKIFYVCSMLVVLSAIWFVFKNTIVSDPPVNPIVWIRMAMMITVTALSIASGFVITFLIQREYEDKTIINVLVAPTPRATFILSKLATWFIWYILVLLTSIIIYIIGGELIYQGDFGFSEIKILFESIASTSLLSFIASIPLLLIAVMQKHTFYPTIMFSLAFTGMEIIALIASAKFSSIIPWSAPMLIGLGSAGEYLSRGLVSIALAGIIGVVGSCLYFKQQNQ